MIANHEHCDATVPHTSPPRTRTIGCGHDDAIAAFKERYAIGKTIGCGEFATVKAAVDRRTNEKVPYSL